MKQSISVFFSLVIVVMSQSCRKGEFAAEHFYGGLSVKSSQVSSADLEVRFDGASSGDSLKAGGTVAKVFDFSGNAIKQGKPVHFSVYIAGTNQRVADTSIVVHKDDRQVYNVVYSDQLGMGGFVNGNDVPQDSVRFRITFHDHTAAKKFKRIELQFYQSTFDPPFYDELNNVKLSFVVDDGGATPDFLVPTFKSDGATSTQLYARIKDLTTGEYLGLFPGAEVFITGIDISGGDMSGGNYLFGNFNLIDNDGSEDGSGVDYYTIEYNYLKL